MVTRIPTASQNGACDVYVDRVDTGSQESNGRLRIYTGNQPASANSEATGTLLAEVDLANPAFGDAGAETAGVATLLGVPLEALGITDGTAGWVRIVNRDGDTCLDMAVDAGEVVLNTNTISTGVAVTVISGTVTQPAGEAA